MKKRFTFEKEKVIRNTACRIYDEDKILFEVNFDLLAGMNSKEVEELCVFLNRLNNENEQLKKENKMLKTTIGRNEAYINRLTNNGKWSNTSRW